MRRKTKLPTGEYPWVITLLVMDVLVASLALYFI